MQAVSELKNLEAGRILGVAMDDVLTTKEVAEKIGRDASHIRRLCIQGEVPGAKKVGRDWHIPKSSVPLIPQGSGKGRPRKAIPPTGSEDVSD